MRVAQWEFADSATQSYVDSNMSMWRKWAEGRKKKRLGLCKGKGAAACKEKVPATCGCGAEVMVRPRTLRDAQKAGRSVCCDACRKKRIGGGGDANA